METKERIFVTGATGFIGGHIVQVLLEKGYRVRAAVRNLKSNDGREFLEQFSNKYTGLLELVEADLNIEGSFDEPVKDCQYVIHAAAIVQNSAKDPWKEIINPALKGTMNILKACQKAKCVKKFILTSSDAAVDQGYTQHLLTEENWNEMALQNPLETPYSYAKTMSEKETVKFVESLPEEERFGLIRICPGLCLGPQLTKRITGSNSVIRTILNAEYPVVPKLFYYTVDVRDVARAHVQAMESEKMQGRYLVINQPMWIIDLCQKMKEIYPECQAPRSTGPNFIFYAAALFDNRLGTISHLRKRLGNRYFLSNEKIEKDFGFQFTPIDKTMRDAAESFFELGLAKRPKKK